VKNNIEFPRPKIVDYGITNPKQLSGAELSALAKQMLEAPTEAEKAALEEKIIEGLYGGKPPAT
jgi:hypothetical protein